MEHASAQLQLTVHCSHLMQAVVYCTSGTRKPVYAPGALRCGTSQHLPMGHFRSTPSTMTGPSPKEEALGTGSDASVKVE